MSRLMPSFTLLAPLMLGCVLAGHPNAAAVGEDVWAAVFAPSAIRDAFTNSQRRRGEHDDQRAPVRVVVGQPFVSYTGAALDRGLDVDGRGDGQAYGDGRAPHFSPADR